MKNKYAGASLAIMGLALTVNAAFAGESASEEIRLPSLQDVVTYICAEEIDSAEESYERYSNKVKVTEERFRLNEKVDETLVSELRDAVREFLNSKDMNALLDSLSGETKAAIRQVLSEDGMTGLQGMASPEMVNRINRAYRYQQTAALEKMVDRDLKAAGLEKSWGNRYQGYSFTDAVLNTWKLMISTERGGAGEEKLGIYIERHIASEYDYTRANIIYANYNFAAGSWNLLLHKDGESYPDERLAVRLIIRDGMSAKEIENEIRKSLLFDLYGNYKDGMVEYDARLKLLNNVCKSAPK
jgi:hypothetical protein